MKLADWLESHWVFPAYAGWLLAGIAICFFAAATNTMAGWLYVLSGTIFALLGLGAILPPRSLRQLTIIRQAIAPVSAGDRLTVELAIKNNTRQPKSLIQVRDLLPFVLSKPQKTPIELIASQKTFQWVYDVETQQRGIYHWHDLELKTASPLGLFWCRRTHQVPAKAIVYPQVLPLSRCPLIDRLGREDSSNLNSDRRSQLATEGLTRSLRPYRRGDSTRLIHWRTSARLGQLQVRELEVVTGGREVIICLDTNFTWSETSFEQAVIAAASLYFYASRCQFNVKLWTSQTDLLHGNRVILETLAAIDYADNKSLINLPSSPLIWLTQNPSTLSQLTYGSRYLLFSTTSQESISSLPKNLPYPGIQINPIDPLQEQLEYSFR